MIYDFLCAFSLTRQKTKQNNKKPKKVIQGSSLPYALISGRFHVMSDLARSRMGHLAYIEVTLGG